MNKLPRSAKFYLALVYLLGVVAVAYAVTTPVPKAQAEHWEMGLFLILATLAGSKKIRLMRTRSAEDHVSISLTFVLTFTATIRFGPSAGVLVGAVGSLANGLFPKRQPWHQLAFNVALTVIATWVAGLFFLQCNAWSLVLRLPETFAAVAGSSLVFFLVNTGGVACVVALCTEKIPSRSGVKRFCGPRPPIWPAPASAP